MATKINLLPWREAQRKEKLQEFASMMGIAALCGAIIVGIVHFYHNKLIERQENRNRFMEDQITLLDKKIAEIEKLQEEKQKLLNRIRAIEQLQGNRPLIVRLFDEMVTSIPDGVSVTSISQKQERIDIKGEAQSNARVSSFMRNLEASKWLKSPKLKIIQGQSTKGVRVSKFELTFRQNIPKASEDEES